MPFTLPNFNVTFKSWRLDPTGSFYSVIINGGPCQWYVNPRIQALALPGSDEEIILHFLRVPKGTDIDEADIVEVPPLSGHFYQLVEWERVHLGFPNEYWVGFANNLDENFAPVGPILVEQSTNPPIDTETGLPLYTEDY